MIKALGYALVLLGVLGCIATAVILAYWALIITVWCPLQACLPQFFVLLLLAGLSFWLFAFTFRRGTKLISRRKRV